jgi:hypothetical protein
LKELQNILLTRTDSIQKLNEMVVEKKKAYKAMRKQAIANLNTIKQLSKEMTHANNKQDAKKMQPLSEKYIDLIKKQKQTVRAMNMYYLSYSANVSKAVAEFELIDKSRIEKLIIIFNELHVNFHKTSETYKHIHRRIVTALYNDDTFNLWSSEMLYFIRVHGIARTNSLPIEFELKPFSFDDDDDFSLRVVGQRFEKACSYPVSFAIAEKDFVSEAENELSVKAGQFLCIFDSGLDKWTLASDNSNEPRGYVPTEALKFCTEIAALAIETRLEDGEFMSLYPGEMIILNKPFDDQCDILTCRKMDGTNGKVRRSDIVVE